MNPSISRFRFLATVAMVGALCVLPALTAQAAGFPEKTITIVVPYTAGGSSDSIARVLAKQLSLQMGQSVIVDNKAGAGATLGTAQVAKAAPDGYTLLLADNAQTTAPAMYPQLPYDPVKSFRGVGMVGVAPAMLFAGKHSHLHTVKDLADAQKSHPAGFTIGVGSGSPSHLISALFQMRSKLKLLMVPYKGASQAAVDVLGGQIDMIFTNAASAGQYAKAGSMTALGASGTLRLAAFPDVPTFQEQGIDGMNVSYWFAVLLPAGVPDSIAHRWERELATALTAPEVSRTLAELGISRSGVTPAQMHRFLEEDKATWAIVVKSSGMKLQ